jgi:hypothetical protein
MISIDQEPDYVPKRLISRSGAIVIATIVVSIIATIALARCRVSDVVHPGGKPPERVEMTRFEDPTEAEKMRTRAEQHLQSYGWVNRATGTIHVPLDVAIEQYLGAQR